LVRVRLLESVEREPLIDTPINNNHRCLKA
jgi:hypothetical protein